jgi:hypothetical protein
MTSDQVVIVGAMAVIVIAAFVGVWNNAPLYDENMCSFRVGFFRFWFTFCINPRGTIDGTALRKYKIKSRHD